MNPARTLLILPLFLLASLADAATSEREIDAEAEKIFPTLFSKCGEDHFSKRTFKYKSGTSYVIHQYKELEALTKIYPLSKADPLNGIEWKAVIQFRAAAGREFAHDERPAGKQGTRSSRKMDAWSEWKEPNLAAFTIEGHPRGGAMPDIQLIPGSDPDLSQTWAKIQIISYMLFPKDEAMRMGFLSLQGGEAREQMRTVKQEERERWAEERGAPHHADPQVFEGFCRKVAFSRVLAFVNH